MLRIALIISLLFLPAAALAQKVAVLPARHEVASTGVVSAEAAKPIQEAVLGAVADAGMTVANEVEVRQAQAEVAPDPAAGCMDRACLEQVAQKVGVDQALRVLVTEIGDMEHQVEIVLARGDGVKEVKEDGLYVVASEVRRMVALALQRAPATPTEPEAPRGTAPWAETTPREEAPWRPTPAMFWISAGVTGALLVGTIITEGVVYSRYKDLEDGGEDEAFWETTRNLQITERVLFACTLAGLATTGLLFYLTDFNQTDTPSESVSWRLAPAIGPDQGGLALTGRF